MGSSVFTIVNGRAHSNTEPLITNWVHYKKDATFQINDSSYSHFVIFMGLFGLLWFLSTDFP